jgi:hypothetical protein
LSEVHQKRQKKVSSYLEEVEEVVWAFALLPRWWFARATALGVVVVVSCFHDKVYIMSLQMAAKVHKPLSEEKELMSWKTLDLGG